MENQDNLSQITPTEGTLRGPIELLTSAWELYKEKLSVLALIMAVPAAITFVMGLFFYTEPQSIEGGLVALALMLVLIVVSIVAMPAMLYVLKREDELLSAPDAYSRAFSILFPIVWVTFLSTAIILAGTLLLIIPGIIFSIWYAFALVVLVMEKKGGLEALKTSREYVRGNWWRVLGRFLFIGLVIIAVYMVVGIFTTILGGVSEDEIPTLAELIAQFLVQVFITPLSTVYVYLLYKDLKAKYETGKSQLIVAR